METTFSLEKLSNLGKSAGIEYVSKNFYPLIDGNHAVLLNGKFTILKNDVAITTYLNRFPSEVKKWYQKDNFNVKSITYELGKPLLFDDKLNLCPQPKHSYKPFESFDTETKNAVKMLIQNRKEILCGNRDDILTHLLKWESNVVKGVKNTSALYVKGEQGAGKTTTFEHFRKYVVGDDLSLETGSRPIVSNFNSQLGGKTFVLFEEMENFSVSQWTYISSKLKRYITSDVIELEGKGTNSYTARNLNNYCIISNHDAIKDEDGRRYFILDVALHRKTDYEYWADFRKRCFNDKVGHAYYCCLMEIDTTDFNPQDFPLTQSKSDSFVKRLDSCYQYIKDCYVLKNISLHRTVKETYEDYELFCANDSSSRTYVYGKIDFNKKLSAVGIMHKAGTANVQWYKKSHYHLLQIAKSNHWLHELDDYLEPQEPILLKGDENAGTITQTQVTVKTSVPTIKYVLPPKYVPTTKHSIEDGFRLIEQIEKRLKKNKQKSTNALSLIMNIDKSDSDIAARESKRVDDMPTIKKFEGRIDFANF